jgi:hypothetical protein
MQEMPVYIKNIKNTWEPLRLVKLKSEFCKIDGNIFGRALKAISSLGVRSSCVSA